MVNGDWSSPCHHPLLPLPLPATGHFIQRFTLTLTCVLKRSPGLSARPPLLLYVPRPHDIFSPPTMTDTTRQGKAQRSRSGLVSSGLFAGWLAGWVNNVMITCIIVRASIKPTLYDTVATFEYSQSGCQVDPYSTHITGAKKKGSSWSTTQHDTTWMDTWIPSCVGVGPTSKKKMSPKSESNR